MSFSGDKANLFFTNFIRTFPLVAEPYKWLPNPIQTGFWSRDVHDLVAEPYRWLPNPIQTGFWSRDVHYLVAEPYWWLPNPIGDWRTIGESESGYE